MRRISYFGFDGQRLLTISEASREYVNTSVCEYYCIIQHSIILEQGYF